MAITHFWRLESAQQFASWLSGFQTKSPDLKKLDSLRKEANGLSGRSCVLSIRAEGVGRSKLCGKYRKIAWCTGDGSQLENRLQNLEMASE